MTALTMSGQKTRRFCFEAFLPSDKKEKSTVLEELKNETRTIVIYEAPHRLVRTLKELRDALVLHYAANLLRNMKKLIKQQLMVQ